MGLKSSEFQDDIARALCGAPLLKQLEVLDLGKGTMTDAGAQAIADSADAFKHLKRLDLDENTIGEDGAKLLRKALDNVQLGEQEDPDEFRYVPVNE